MTHADLIAEATRRSGKSALVLCQAYFGNDDGDLAYRDFLRTGELAHEFIEWLRVQIPACKHTYDLLEALA